ncbi:amidase [Maritimibacter fusiformis]|uniref:Amidase n=1 Tax=Maritimibacter fusiformis TaxID=2603819 RepID=A0A5D0R9V5_9RHOB|nr:amidase family protein [Maritimibacter fusiformis]TYB77869.1 amidase [Maritimibacter fusiformis]
MADDWRWQTAAELGRGIEAGRIDPVDLAGTLFDAIKAHPHGDRIYARLTEDRAMAEAKASSRRAKLGQRLGPLDGVPISWKDLFDTAGTATEAGSALLRDRVPDMDAEVVQMASAEGLVGLGKTHMSELAFSGLGLNPITATPPCVNDEGAVSGGSSSGAAASVAFGLAPAAIGSDTGGSVRIPAAWNDLVGLKTTWGRLSARGTVPLAARFDTTGPLCRSVEDAALLLAALEGRKRTTDLTGASLRGVRLLVLENGLTEARDEPRAGFDLALGRLMGAGVEVSRAAFDIVDEALGMSAILFTTEAYAIWRDAIEADPDAMYPQIRDRFRTGGQFSGADYVAAWKRLDVVRAEFHRLTAGVDAVVLPTAANMPPNLERLMTDQEYYVTENLLTLSNTRIGNLMGSAALTLPTGMPSTGIMFLGAPMSDERLLRLGAAAERALA